MNELPFEDNRTKWLTRQYTFKCFCKLSCNCSLALWDFSFFFFFLKDKKNPVSSFLSLRMHFWLPADSKAVIFKNY